jgi:hypothetical protein
MSRCTVTRTCNSRPQALALAATRPRSCHRQRAQMFQLLVRASHIQLRGRRSKYLRAIDGPRSRATHDGLTTGSSSGGSRGGMSVDVVLQLRLDVMLVFALRWGEMSHAHTSCGSTRPRCTCTRCIIRAPPAPSRHRPSILLPPDHHPRLCIAVSLCSVSMRGVG